jgi:type IV secretory pathway VirB10-like protein
MNMYITVLTLAWLINLIGFLWLVVVGFKRSVVWGVLVFLFSPISAIVFAVTNWFDARKAFLVYLVSFLLMIGTGVAIFTSIGLQNLQQIAARVDTGELRPDEAMALMRKALEQGGSVDLFAEQTPQPADAAAAPTELKPGQLSPTPQANSAADVAQANQLAEAEKPAPESESKPGSTESTGKEAMTESAEESTTDTTGSADTSAAKEAETKPAQTKAPSPKEVQLQPSCISIANSSGEMCNTA